MKNWKLDLIAVVYVLATIAILMTLFSRSEKPACTGPVDTLFTDCVDSPPEYR